MSADQAFDSRNAGTRSLVVARLLVNDGNGGANYSVTTTRRRQHHAGAADPERDDRPRSTTAAPLGGAPTATGLVAGDSVSGLRQAFDSRNAGSRNLLVTGYTVNDGNGGANYALTTVAAPGLIDRATLTLGAVTDTKVYDGTTASARGADRRLRPGRRRQRQRADPGLRQPQRRQRAAIGVTGYTVNDGNGGGNYTVADERRRRNASCRRR